jgi:hypothetical protein
MAAMQRAALDRFEAYLEQRQAEIDAAVSAARNSIEKYLNDDKLGARNEISKR